MATWSAIHTKPACEFDVTFRVGLLGFENYCPLYRKQRHHNHRLEVVVKPLFPRYIFARFDRTKNDWTQIMREKGVCDVLRDAMGIPYFIRDNIMSALQSALEAPIAANDQPAIMQPGDRVRLLSGPFAGLDGLFCGDANKRVSVMLALFGRPTKVSVDRAGVEAVG